MREGADVDVGLTLAEGTDTPLARSVSEESLTQLLERLLLPMGTTLALAVPLNEAPPWSDLRLRCP